MNRESLERLAANPHYKMSQRQIDALNRLRSQDMVAHSAKVPRHDTGFRKHDVRVKKEDEDERTD